MSGSGQVPLFTLTQPSAFGDIDTLNNAKIFFASVASGAGAMLAVGRIRQINAERLTDKAVASCRSARAGKHTKGAGGSPYTASARAIFCKLTRQCHERRRLPWRRLLIARTRPRCLPAASLRAGSGRIRIHSKPRPARLQARHNPLSAGQS